MEKPTSGPWHVEPGGERPVNSILMVVSAADDLGPVCFVTKVNAPLVAAAPDLLAACQAHIALLALSDPGEFIRQMPIVDGMIRAAIAKVCNA